MIERDENIALPISVENLQRAKIRPGDVDGNSVYLIGLPAINGQAGIVGQPYLSDRVSLLDNSFYMGVSESILVADNAGIAHGVQLIFTQPEFGSEDLVGVLAQARRRGHLHV